MRTDYMKRRMNIIEEIIFSCVYHNPTKLIYKE